MTGQMNETTPDARREPRTSLFAMATLYAGLGSAPVKVRDLSSGGALVEGAAIPSPGTSVRLCRGSLHITGEIVWCRGQRAGLRFKSRLAVADWLPGGGVKTHQQRVDSIFQEAKASQPAHSPVSRHQQTPESGRLGAVELTEIRTALESLADDLAADPHVVEGHMSKLQTLDIAAQALGKLAAER